MKQTQQMIIPDFNNETKFNDIEWVKVKDDELEEIIEDYQVKSDEWGRRVKTLIIKPRFVIEDKMIFFLHQMPFAMFIDKKKFIQMEMLMNRLKNNKLLSKYLFNSFAQKIIASYIDKDHHILKSNVNQRQVIQYDEEVEENQYRPLYITDLLHTVNPSYIEKKDFFKGYNMKQIKKLGKHLNIKKIYKMRKQKLIELIFAHPKFDEVCEKYFCKKSEWVFRVKKINSHDDECTLIKPIVDINNHEEFEPSSYNFCEPSYNYKYFDKESDF